MLQVLYTAHSHAGHTFPGKGQQGFNKVSIEQEPCRTWGWGNRGMDLEKQAWLKDASGQVCWSRRKVEGCGPSPMMPGPQRPPPQRSQ